MSEAKESPEDIKELGNKAFAEKNYSEAIDYYTQAIKLDPSNPVFFSNRSASYAGLQDWTRAAEDAKECIRLDPNFLKAYYRLATAQIEMQDYDHAMATLGQGLAMDNHHPQLLKLMRTVQQKVQQEQSKGQPGNVVLDDAVRQEVQDLQMQHMETVKEHGSVEAFLAKTQREFRLQELTCNEVEQLADDTKCYRSIGKMFLLSTKERVVEHLHKQLEESKKRETDLTQKVDYLERRIKSQRQNMQELLAPSGSVAE